ncbi:hypothetical protein KI387_016429, partial [Taxus chinensis]
MAELGEELNWCELGSVLGGVAVKGELQHCFLAAMHGNAYLVGLNSSTQVNDGPESCNSECCPVSDLFITIGLCIDQMLRLKKRALQKLLSTEVFFLVKSLKAYTAVALCNLQISPWHDIPLQLGDGVFNFIAEIPKESSAKMEVATEELYTPIKQDTKKGKLRYYPYNINWNYGLLPQTWEDPSFANAEVEGALGDNDPVDIVEIGQRRAKIGEILKVKPLAALAMIDEGELDWKIVAISIDDPRASLVNDIDDVEKHFPGTLIAIRNWFRDYKIPDGKPANKFGLGNKAANKIRNLSLRINVFLSFHAIRIGASSCIWTCSGCAMFSVIKVWPHEAQ